MPNQLPSFFPSIHPFLLPFLQSFSSVPFLVLLYFIPFYLKPFMPFTVVFLAASPLPSFRRTLSSIIRTDTIITRADTEEEEEEEEVVRASRIIRPLVFSDVETRDAHQSREFKTVWSFMEPAL